MKKSNLLLFLICCIVFTTNLFAQSTTSKKTFVYDQYQQGQAYKGVPFGSSIQTVNTKMNLGDANWGGLFYPINKKDYLVFNNFKFDEGQVYFTKGGQFFQIVLTINDTYPSCPLYHRVKKSLLDLFGTNDAEYTDPYNDKPNKSLSISWEGINLTISLQADPDSKDKGKGTVTLIIFHKKLNDLQTKELLKRSTEIPRI